MLLKFWYMQRILVDSPTLGFERIFKLTHMGISKSQNALYLPKPR